MHREGKSRLPRSCFFYARVSISRRYTVVEKFLVFVEVKLRKSDSFAQAREYVDRHKQDRIRLTASMYLSQYPTDLQPRFDVIEIYAPEGQGTINPKIQHLEDAFQ